MDTGALRRIGALVLILIGVWLGVKYLFPIFLPFILALAFALLAEPGVKFLHEKLHLPRAAASGISVTFGFVMIFVLVWLLGAAAYRELAALASGMPAFFARISDLTVQIRDWALDLAARAPDGLSTFLGQWVTNLFTSGSVLLEKVAGSALGLVGNLMGGLSGGALTVGTMVIASFMISAQLPSIKQYVARKLPADGVKKWPQAVRRLKEAVVGWLKAQVKLSGMTMLILGAGFLILRIKNGLLWAVVVALVDAVPVLGTGTVLIPWCLICFVRGETARALGLLGVYVTAAMTRSALEPKVVGHQLGINPLLSLLAMYAGYQIWGISGMILAPVLAVTAKQLSVLKE